jgi:hypothetical protein
VEPSAQQTGALNCGRLLSAGRVDVLVVRLGVLMCEEGGGGASVGWHHVVTLMMCGPVSRVMVLYEVFMASWAAHDSMGCI